MDMDIIDTIDADFLEIGDVFSCDGIVGTITDIDRDVIALTVWYLDDFDDEDSVVLDHGALVNLLGYTSGEVA